VAGGPLEANAYKCQLKPIDPRDYAVTFTRDEMARLQAIFPRRPDDHRAIPDAAP